MAISLGAIGTPATGTATLSLTVPAGAAAGQVAVMSVVSSAVTDVVSSVTASGWTQLTPAKDNGSGTPYPTITVLWKALVSGDIGATVPLTFLNAPSTCAGVISTYAGADTTAPFDAELSGIETGASVFVHTIGPITTTLDTDWVVYAIGDRSGASTWTPAGGYTERTDTNTAGSNLETCDSNGTVAHGSISVVATSTSQSSQVVWWIGGLKAAAAGTDSGPNYAGTGTDLGGFSGSWADPSYAAGTGTGTFATWTVP